MLPPASRRRVRCGVAVLLVITLARPAGHAADAPTPSPAPSASATLADPAAELLQIEAEARALDPAAPDASARLRDLIARLARITAQLASDTARLRAGMTRSAARSAAAPAKSTTGSGKTAAGKTAATGAVESTASATGPFFAKRGLKKFHRAGCRFGEAVKPGDRVHFAAASEAAAAGLEPCKVCRPGP